MGDDIIVRVRTREGLERVHIARDATVAMLRAEIVSQLGLDESASVQLSSSKEFLTSASHQGFPPLAGDSCSLHEAKISHGDIVYCKHSMSERVAKPGAVKANPVRNKMTVDDLVAQEIRVGAQTDPHCCKVSFCRVAAQAFQAYVNANTGFSVMRCGWLYGTMNAETREVKVQAIYEPRQEGGTDRFILLSDGAAAEGGGSEGGSEGGKRGRFDSAEMRVVDLVASELGLRRVGFIYSQAIGMSGGGGGGGGGGDGGGASSNGGARGDGDDEAATAAAKESQLRASEVFDIASIQAEFQESFPMFVTGIVRLVATNDSMGMPEIHFEAFQVSDQLCSLVRDDIIIDPHDESRRGSSGNEPLAGGMLETTRDIMVASRETGGGFRDTRRVDSDMFLIPVSIVSHDPEWLCEFPIENRDVGVPQSRQALSKHLIRLKKARMVDKLRDFHLLTYLALSEYFDNNNNNIALICQAVKNDQDIQEGHQMIFEDAVRKYQGL